jgi:hypothetical protein
VNTEAIAAVTEKHKLNGEAKEFIVSIQFDKYFFTWLPCIINDYFLN